MPDQRMIQHMQARLSDHNQVMVDLWAPDRLARILEISQVIFNAAWDNRGLFVCGNGGSGAQAIHLVEELVGRYRDDRVSLEAWCLNSDPGVITCIANDYGYEQVFARQLDGIHRPNAVLVVMTTSGMSENLVNALKMAKRRGMKTVGILGSGGGDCYELCDYPLVVAGRDTAHIQEAHLVVIHLICEHADIICRRRVDAGVDRTRTES